MTNQIKEHKENGFIYGFCNFYYTFNNQFCVEYTAEKHQKKRLANFFIHKHCLERNNLCLIKRLILCSINFTFIPKKQAYSLLWDIFNNFSKASYNIYLVILLTIDYLVRFDFFCTFILLNKNLLPPTSI